MNASREEEKGTRLSNHLSRFPIVPALPGTQLERVRTMQDKARQGIRKEEEIKGNNPDMEISFFSLFLFLFSSFLS
jgi:hypothetical protein